MSLALVLPSVDVPRWVAAIVREVVAGGHGRIAAVRLVPPDNAGMSGAARVILAMYERVDAAIFGHAADPGCLEPLPEPAAERIARGAPAEIDVVLRFDGRIGPIAEWPSPRLGTWSVDHLPDASEELRTRVDGLPPGSLELLRGQVLLVTQLVGADSDRTVAGQVVSRVDQLSVRRGARGHLRKVAAMVVAALAHASASGDLPRRPLLPVPGWATSATPDLTVVGVGMGLGRVVGGYFLRLLQRSIAPMRWQVAVGSSVAPGPPTTRPPMRFLEAPAGRIWADPFPVVVDGERFLFVEELVAGAGRGRLARVRLDGSVRGWSSVDTILELPHHLSYPFVFEHEGAWYLLPEQSSVGRLDLYRSDSPTGRWTWHSTLLESPLADATIVRIGETWWMFAAVAVPGSTAADELHLFHAPDPAGPWCPHTDNPIAWDVRTARAAGRIYEVDGRWYRLAQDGGHGYGHSIAILRIDRIDPEAYVETLVDVIRPDWAPRLEGTHTLNRDGSLTAMDAMIRRPRYRPIRSMPRSPWPRA